MKVFEEGLISTQENHEGLSHISKSKDLIIFTRSDKNFETSGLYISKYANDHWSVPGKLELTGSTYEAGISFSPKMDKAFFTNKSKLKNGDSTNLWNIWEVEVVHPYKFIPNTAKPVGGSINSEFQDCCLTLNSNGNVYFASDRDGSWDIYSAEYVDGTFKNVQKIGAPINLSTSGEWPSYVNDDNSVLYFSSIRKNGMGGDDIYVSHKKNGKWQEPKLLGNPINTTSYEDGFMPCPDGKYLFFSSWRNTSTSKGVSNIHVLPSRYFPEN